MSDADRAREVEQEFDHLVQAGACAEALELVTRWAHVFPEHAQKVVYSWRMAMACRLGNAALALELLREAVEAGYWYAGLRDDPDYQLLRGTLEFERLAELCMERRARAMAEAGPVVQVLQPERQAPPYPLLVALHGGGSNVESFAGHWRAAADHGWLVGLPQSSQTHGPGTFTWNDWDWALQEVQQRYAALCAGPAVDPQRTALAGFSQGGGVAAWLALSGAVHVRGLILVGPFLAEVDAVIPLLEARRPEGLRAFIAAGERDRYCCGVARRLAELLPCYGVACELEVYPDLEHSFPPGFERRLPQALDYVLQG